MIAPKDFTKKMKLYLYVTDHMVKQFAFGQTLPNASDIELPSDWWSVWRSEVLITDPDGNQNIVLFTNAATLVSFICAGVADDFGGMIKDFESRFLGFLEAKGVTLPEHVSTSLTVMSGEPETLSDDAWWLVDCVKKDLIEGKLEPLDAEFKLNASPASEMGGGSPLDYFEVEMEKQSPWPQD